LQRSWSVLLSEGECFFFEKKKQKTFVKLGRADFNATVPVKQKFFAPPFFKKAAACLFPANPITL
jgi:hypothetical protein